jgi:hypothetical protein
MRIKEVNVARGARRRCFYPQHNQHSVLGTSQCEALSPPRAPTAVTINARGVADSLLVHRGASNICFQN